MMLKLARPKQAAREPLEDLQTVAREGSAMGQDRVSLRLEGHP